MSVERRTLREWVAYLDSVERELTLSELMALLLMNQREYARLTLEAAQSIREGGEHIESMLGALDVLASQLAAINGLPYAADAESRAALHAARRRRLHGDEDVDQRRLPAAGRRDHDA